MLNIAQLQSHAHDVEKVKLSFEWQEGVGKSKKTVSGECWLLTDKSLSFAAKQRATTATARQDLLELNLCLLVDRIRFGDDGSEKLNSATARQMVEQPNELFSALIDAAYVKIKALRDEQGEAEEAKN
ncbi:hypothetical protein [uncultured Gilvimarinus sp.]|uniref:hypothetical protein n=1 Tax=uncultured Gilvimarinus sp. TaxID=1689143 RepID=UPI0030DB3ECA